MKNLLGITRRALPAALLAMACASTASANPLAEQGNQMAFMGGKMQGAAQVCGGYSAAELDAMADEHRTIVVAMGVDAKAFDAHFERGVESGKASLRNASPDEREKTCDQLRQMAAAGR